MSVHNVIVSHYDDTTATKLLKLLFNKVTERWRLVITGSLGRFRSDQEFGEREKKTKTNVAWRETERERETNRITVDRQADKHIHTQI